MYGARSLGRRVCLGLMACSFCGAIFGLWVLQATATSLYCLDHLFSEPWLVFPPTGEVVFAALGGMLGVMGWTEREETD